METNIHFLHVSACDATLASDNDSSQTCSGDISVGFGIRAHRDAVDGVPDVCLLL